MCDSVIAKVKSNKSPTPKQFVVFERVQAYPQFIVALKIGKEKTSAPPVSAEVETQEEQEEEEEEDKNGKEVIHEQPEDE